MGKYDSLLAEYQRNSTDDFTGGIDWKPVQGTKLTFEEEINHYKDRLLLYAGPERVHGAGGGRNTGLPWRLGQPDRLRHQRLQYRQHGQRILNASSYTILSAPQTTGGLPIINPACDVVTSYLRSQPTRILYPTEIFRFQSTSIKNVSMNGDFRYTNANMNLPNYYENFQGLDWGSRQLKRESPPHTLRRQSLRYVYGQRDRTAGGGSCRLWHRLAGYEDVQSLRTD